MENIAYSYNSQIKGLNLWDPAPRVRARARLPWLLPTGPRYPHIFQDYKISILSKDGIGVLKSPLRRFRLI